MEVILLTDIEKLGKKNACIQVKPGYARNYLLERGLAIIATPQAKKEVATRIEKNNKLIESLKDEAKQIAQKLKNVTLTILRKTTKTGKLYGAINEKVLVTELKKQANITMSEESLVLPEHIKSVGIYKVEVKLSDETDGHFKVQVKEEK